MQIRAQQEFGFLWRAVELALVEAEDEISNSPLIALRLEFEKACGELLLGANADDDKRRQDLAKLMLSLAREPGSDPTSAWRP